MATPTWPGGETKLTITAALCRKSAHKCHHIAAEVRAMLELSHLDYRVRRCRTCGPRIPPSSICGRRPPDRCPTWKVWTPRRKNWTARGVLGWWQRWTECSLLLNCESPSYREKASSTVASSHAVAEVGCLQVVSRDITVGDTPGHVVFAVSFRCVGTPRLPTYEGDLAKSQRKCEVPT